MGLQRFYGTTVQVGLPVRRALQSGWGIAPETQAQRSEHVETRIPPAFLRVCSTR